MTQSSSAAVVALAAAVQLGELLSYDDLQRELSLLPEQLPVARQVIRSAVAAAKPILLRDYGRVLVAQRGRGYRVIRPGELAAVAQSHRARGERQLQRALAIVTQSDVTGMTDREFQYFQATRTVIVAFNERLAQHDRAIEELRRAVFGPPKPPAAGEVIERREAPQ